MPKKTNNNSDEKVLLALDEHRWINTPVIYTNKMCNLTRFQQDVMLMVSGRLQDHLKKFLDEDRYKDKERPKSMIAKDDLVRGIEPIRLPLTDVAVGDTHYDVVDDMVQALRDLYVYAPVFDKETGLKKGMDYMPIFKKIFVPSSTVTKEGKEYAYAKKYDENGNEITATRNDGYLDVTINDEVAAYAFDMSQGYFNHLERIAYFCNSAYTSRLYLLLMKYVSRGEMHPAIDYRDIKEHLGMFDREPKSEKIKSEKYEKFSQFRKQVLDVAKRDMDRLCEENKIEIQLASTEKCKEGYEPLYRGMAKRGNPEKIKFHIKRTPLGVARELEMHRGSSEQHLVTKLTSLYPTLDKNVLAGFIASVPDDLWPAFKQYAYKEIPAMVEKPHQWDGTVDSYIMYIMQQWIDNQNKQTSTTEPTLQFADDNQQKTPVAPAYDAKKYLKEWQETVGEYQGPIKDVLLRGHFAGAKPNDYPEVFFLLEDNNIIDANVGEWNIVMEMMKRKTGLRGPTGIRRKEKKTTIHF